MTLGKVVNIMIL